MQWFDAADLIVKDMEGVNLLKCAEFADAIIDHSQSQHVIIYG